MEEADMERAEEAACVVPEGDIAVVVGKEVDCRGEDTKPLVKPRANEGSSSSAAAAAWVPDNLVMVGFVVDENAFNATSTGGQAGRRAGGRRRD